MLFKNVSAASKPVGSGGKTSFNPAKNDEKSRPLQPGPNVAVAAAAAGNAIAGSNIAAGALGALVAGTTTTVAAPVAAIVVGSVLVVTGAITVGVYAFRAVENYQNQNPGK